MAEGIFGPIVRTDTAPVNTTVSVTTSSTAVLSSNAARKGLILTNNDPASTIYVNLNGGTATTTSGVRLNATGGSIFIDVVVPTSAITAIATGSPSSSNLLAVEIV